MRETSGRKRLAPLSLSKLTPVTLLHSLSRFSVSSFSRARAPTVALFIRLPLSCVRTRSRDEQEEEAPSPPREERIEKRDSSRLHLKSKSDTMRRIFGTKKPPPKVPTLEEAGERLTTRGDT